MTDRHTTNTTPALTPEREADEPQTVARGLTPTEALLRLMADTTSSPENAKSFAEAADKERQAEIRERWAGALYESVHAFQMAAQLGGLQHAQMRGYLAEHLRDFLLGEGGPAAVLLAELDRVRAERDALREHVGKLVAGWKQASTEHQKFAESKVMDEYPGLADKQEGRSSQLLDCSDELADVLNGEDPDDWEHGIGLDVLDRTERADSGADQPAS